MDESQQFNFALELAKKGYQVTINEIPEIENQVKEKYGNLFKYQSDN